MLKASGAGARLKASSIPTIKGVWKYAKKVHIPAGTKNNLAYVNEKIIWAASISEDAEICLLPMPRPQAAFDLPPKGEKGKLIAPLFKGKLSCCIWR